MIELLIVVAIMAIAAAVVVPMAGSTGATQLRAAANIVAADLEYAKSLSISRGQRHSVVFDKVAESYTIVNEGGLAIEHPLRKGGAPYTVAFASDGRLDQVDIADVNFDSTATVSFDYLGSPYNGSVTALNSGVVTLRAGTSTRTVRVEPVTGFITVSN